MTSAPLDELAFAELGIASKLLEQLHRNNFTLPTPIQHKAIPVALLGQDIVGIAQTGTGKTLAFGVPMIQRLGHGRGQGLVLLPTRELAEQVNETLIKIGRPLGLKTAVIIGGTPIGAQKAALRAHPHIIIATPGRLVDHLEQRTVSLQNIKVVVLDEADRMLDIGFAPQIKRILGMIPTERQTMLFSATMPREIAALAAQHMRQPIRIEAAPPGQTVERVQQTGYIVAKDAKLRLLDWLLAHHQGTVLLFSRTKHGAKKIAVAVRQMEHTAVEIHSNRSLPQRRAALAGFKSGSFRVLVATDIAARGIDVTGIALVINYDLPDNSEDYVHRIGRTARAGRAGLAISFIEPGQHSDLRDIQRLIRGTIPLLPLPTLPPARAIPYVARDVPAFYGRSQANRQHQRGGHPSHAPRSHSENFGGHRRPVNSARYH